MRHQNRIKKLGRPAAHRKATLAALSNALIRHKRITTTLVKAKALRSYVEPILNRAKEDNTSNRRQAFRHLQDKESIKELFGDIAGMISDRPGGYTRIVKLGTRQGDAAEMAVIELVDYNDVQPDGTGKTRTRRTRRSSGRSRSGGKATTEGTPKADAPKAEKPAPPTPDTAGPSKPAGSAEPEDSKVTENPTEEVEDQGGAQPNVPPPVPQSHPFTGSGSHPDAQQGAAPGTGEPPPESQPETKGRGGEHRG